MLAAKSTNLPSLADALAWLGKHDAKRLDTYNPTSGTVTCNRKVWRRRLDGTIIGQNHGTATFRWEKYARDVREYVAFKMEQAAQAEIAAQHRAREAAEDREQARSRVRDAIKVLRQGRTALAEVALVPEAHRALAEDLVRRSIDQHAETVRFWWARR